MQGLAGVCVFQAFLIPTIRNAFYTATPVVCNPALKRDLPAGRTGIPSPTPTPGCVLPYGIVFKLE